MKPTFFTIFHHCSSDTDEDEENDVLSHSAMGMYLKCIHYFMKAFFDKCLSPEERVFKMWYCKTFFVTRTEGTTDSSQFIRQ